MLQIYYWEYNLKVCKLFNNHILVISCDRNYDRIHVVQKLTLGGLKITLLSVLSLLISCWMFKVERIDC